MEPRYSYALNNPLKYTDPDGLYEWAQACASDDKQCQGYRQQFRDALDTIRGAVQNLDEGSAERAKLQAILDKYGDEGEKNKVFVAFGSAGGYPAHEDTTSGFFGIGKKSTVTFDMGMLNSTFESGTKGNQSMNAAIGFAETVTHEGSHMLDGGNPSNKAASYRTEFNSFDAQSLVPMALHEQSWWQLWNPSWAAADAETMRKSAVKRTTEQHVNAMWDKDKKKKDDKK